MSNIVSSPIYQLLLGLLALAALYYAIIGIREKRPRVGIFDQTLLSGAKSALQGLAVTFNGIPQDRITVARVIFWNDGREAIRKEDFTRDHLRFELDPGANLLAASIVAVTSEACAVTAQLELASGVRQAIRIDFDVLNHRDGFTLQVVHDGAAGHPIRTLGTLANTRKPEEFWLDFAGRVASGSWARTRMLLMWLALALFLLAGVTLEVYLESDTGFWVSFVAYAVFMWFAPRLTALVGPRLPAKLGDSLTTGVRPLYRAR